MRSMKGRIGSKFLPLFIIIAISLVVFSAGPASAEPILQLYAEGATYNSVTQSWEKSYAPGETLRLWTIAWTTSKGPIYDVKLSIAYDSQPAAPAFTLTSSTTGGYGGYVDPSTPSAAVFSQYRNDGSTPTLGDGSSLPGHSIFGAGTDWTEYRLGDFDKADSLIADFTTGTWVGPIPPPGTKYGQINVYEIVVSGLLGDDLHFDLYDHYVSQSRMHYKFAPFSHDATFITPEAGALLLFGTGLIGLVGYRRVRRMQ